MTVERKFEAQSAVAPEAQAVAERTVVWEERKIEQGKARAAITQRLREERKQADRAARKLVGKQGRPPRKPRGRGMYRQCQGKTKKGVRCRGGAMKGSSFCGPHQWQERRKRNAKRQRASSWQSPRREETLARIRAELNAEKDELSVSDEVLLDMIRDIGDALSREYEAIGSPLPDDIVASRSYWEQRSAN